MTRLETILLVAFAALALLAMHFRDKAVEAGRATAGAVTQEKVTAGTSAASDLTARDVRVIIEKGQKEIEYVETLPGADTPIDPVRRAGKCAALARVLEHPVCADDQADGKPASAVSDRVGTGEAGNAGR